MKTDAMFRLAGRFLREVTPGVVRPLHALWNEVIGFVFLVLAVLILFSTWRRTAHDPDGFWVLVTGTGFGVLLAGFGVSSFLKARKISRS